MNRTRPMPGPSHASTIATDFDPRANSLGFLRWLFAAMVVVAHAFPIAGIGPGVDPMWTVSRGQDSLGGIAVAGFFVISGFLVTRSWFTAGSVARFLWRRFLRIFPAFWVCLIVTAGVLAPIAWHHEVGGFTGVFAAPVDSPLHYVTSNALLQMHQFNIGGLLHHTPYASSGFPPAWDGSLWTLIYEFRCYLALGVLGMIGLLRGRTAIGVSCVALYAVMLSWLVDPQWAARVVPVFGDVYIARFGFLFALGAVLAVFAGRIPLNDRLGVASLVVAAWSLHFGGWLAIGYPAFGYGIFWLAVRLPVRRWERYGDLSYGTYIWAFPLQMLLADYGAARFGGLAFTALSIVAASVAAFLSWHLVEKHALRLKSWNPRRDISRLVASRYRAARPVGIAVPHPEAVNADTMLET